MSSNSKLFSQPFYLLIILSLFISIALPIPLIAASTLTKTDNATDQGALLPALSPWGAPVQVSSRTFLTVKNPQIAVYNDNLYAAWVGETGSGYDAFFAKSTDGGSTWEADVQLTENESAFPFDFSLAVAGDGSIHLAYTYDRSWPADDEIRLIRSNDGGQSWSQTATIAPEPYRWAMSEPQILTDTGNGDLYLAWVEGNNDMYLVFARSQDGGASWGVKTQLLWSSYEEWGGGYDMASSGDTIYVLADPINGDVVTGDKFFKSLDGGQSWNGIAPPSGFEAGGQIASPGANKVYVLYYDYNAGSQVLAGSSDGGGSWTTNNMPLSTYSVLAVGSSGKLVSASSGGTLNVIESEDGGQSWSSPVNVSTGANEVNLATDPASGSAAVVWSSGNTVWAAVSGGTSPSPSLVEVQISTNTLTRNSNGWYTENPIKVTVTVNNVTGAELDAPSLLLTGDTPFVDPFSDEREGRFYVLEENGYGDGAYEYQGVQYLESASLAPIAAGETVSSTLRVWVQPSITTTLSITVELHNGYESLGQDTTAINVPQANIHPLIIVPGYIGTWPPKHGGKLDPILHVYDNILGALQQAGYELGPAGSGASLIPFGYDWRFHLWHTGRYILSNDIQTLQNLSPAEQKPYVDYSQVDILTHSAGGLVTRSYLQDTTLEDPPNVDKVVMLAAPNKGLPPAYKGWYGGDPGAFGLEPWQVGALLGALAKCEGDPSLADDGLHVITSGEMFNYVRSSMPSAEDFLPTVDVTPDYLIDYDTNIPYPLGQPGSPFLDDLNSPGGAWDVTRLTAPTAPTIYSSFSGSEDTDLQYRVIAPETGSPLWEYGEPVLASGAIGPGDNFVPAYSADLTQVATLTDAGNIEVRREDALLGESLNHLTIPSNPKMVRQILLYLSSVQTDEGFWNTPSPSIPPDVWGAISCSPVRILVTDPLGRQAGHDLNTGEVINQIPGAYVSEPDEEHQLVFILGTVAGEYQVTGLGTDEGPYRVGAVYSSESSEGVIAQVFSGETTVGQIYQFPFDPALSSPGTPIPSADIGDYAVFGLNSVWLRQGSDLYSGHVGAQSASPGPVLASGSEVTIGRNVTFHDPVSAIAGDTVKLKLGADVFDIFHNELNPASNATYSQVITPLNLPLVNNLPILPEIIPGSTNYILAQNERLTLPAGAYGDVTLKKNAVLTLTGGVYHLANLNLGDKSQIVVTAPTEIRIANRLQPGEKAVIGPDLGSGLNATDLVFFIAGINGNSGNLGGTPKAAVIGLNNVVTATLYAPNGTLWLKQGTEARGAFIGRDVKIGYNAQVWIENAFAGGYQSP